MNLLSRYKILPLICLGLASQGCKKLIQVDPPVSVVGTEQVFSNNGQAQSAMAGVFSQMMTNAGGMNFCNGGLTIYAGMSADELMNASGTASVNDQQFNTNALDFTNSIPNSIIWSPAYKIIYNANAVIEGIAASTATQLDDSTRKVLTGEALFVRAFCHFYLTNLFGDVPLIVSTNYKQHTSMVKTPQAKVYSQIIADLQNAETMLPADFSTGGGERVRPNRWAAKALLARTRLYLEEWEEAERLSSEVIASGQFALLSNLNSVFLKNSRESIWQLKQNPLGMPNNATWEGTNLLPIIRWNQLSADEQFLFQMPDLFPEVASYMVPPYYLSRQAVQAFESGDRRKRMWTDSTPTPVEAPFNGVPFVYANKYTLQQGTTTGTITQYYTVLRLAEQHLIRAEARAELNNITGAAADIDTLRSRAGLRKTTANTKETLLAAIARERQTELFAEWGHRWLDLKRTGRADAVLGSITAKQPWKSYQLLYPIPPSEISANPAIIQNPDY